MKLYLSVAIATFLMTGTASAQHVNIGIKGGLNLYNIHYNNNTTYDIKPGFHAGLIGHTHISQRWALQPEVMFSSQGTKYNAGNLDTKLKAHVPYVLRIMT